MDTSQDNVKQPKVHHEENDSFQCVFWLFVKLDFFLLFIHVSQNERSDQKKHQQNKKNDDWQETNCLHFKIHWKHSFEVWKQEVHEWFWVSFKNDHDDVTFQGVLFEELTEMKIRKTTMKQSACEENDDHQREVDQKKLEVIGEELPTDSFNGVKLLRGCWGFFA